MAIESFNGADRIDIGNGKELDLYHADGVSITVVRGNGQTVVLRNFQDGDMISADKTNNKLESMSDPQGSSAGSVSGDNLGTMNSTLQQGSSSNELMSDMYNGDEVFSLWVRYGHEKFGGDHCMLQKAPTANFGKSVPMRQWNIQAFDYNYDGNYQN
ncbi:hypothetical protein [Apilactobacillus micheneri]|uniref:hypothetical protein n=1 Tax=Apilactobacillus micheneri TaxID=1899430 RepID=UPI00112EE8DF|nr:hypothetical protein [Apilactobacillus micheneri]TPR40404.1 hypothetical protein DY119_01570 [Apilactobacillus micheneri]